MGNSAGKESRAGDSLYDAPPALGASAAAGGPASSPSTSSSRRYSRHRQSSSASGSGLAATRSAVRHALNMEETVDGGYLVPQGVYSGTPDFKARVVRQLMIERRLAPFFKGLEDYDDSWTDTQLLAAIRHQPIPAAEPETSVVSTSVDSTISHSYSSRSRSESNASSASTSSQQHYQRIPSGRARSGTTSSTGSNSGVDKKGALATALYRNSIECPICFLYYPPFLNSTRCCDQPICSECFVQIKRPEPHVPEHETPAAPGSPEPAPPHVTPFGMVELISECACCPYCTEPDFGVTYTPPPFRSGLGASQSAGSVLRATLSRHSSAAGSSVSVGSAGSTMSSSSTTTPTTGRQRRPTIASTAAEVVTTDRIRPDWQLKLANANAHAARRAAAATALHSAAFLLDSNGNSAGGVGAVGGASRSGSHAGEASGSGRRHRHHRVPRPSGLDLLISGMHGHGHSNNSNNSNNSNSNSNNSNSNNSSSITILSSSGSSSNSSSSTNLSMAQGHSPTRRVSSLLSGSSARSLSQRSRRMVDLEDMMVMEAIRISLIEDEQRREQERDAVERGAAEHLRRRLSATSTTSSNGGSVSASSPALPVQEEEEEEDVSEQQPRQAVAEEEENKQGTTTASAERATVSAV